MNQVLNLAEMWELLGILNAAIGILGALLSAYWLNCHRRRLVIGSLIVVALTLIVGYPLSQDIYTGLTLLTKMVVAIAVGSLTLFVIFVFSQLSSVDF